MVLAENSKIINISRLNFYHVVIALILTTMLYLVKCLILAKLNLAAFSVSIIGIAIEIVTLNNYQQSFNLN